jgi:hypothetical protein
MKSASAALADHIGLENTSLCMCVKIILTKYQPQILRIFNSNPGLVQTQWPHGFVDGDTTRIVGVRGMTELNNREFNVLRVDNYFFRIDQDTTAYGEYENKGEARKVIGFTEFIRDLILDSDS